MLQHERFAPVLFQLGHKLPDDVIDSVIPDMRIDATRSSRRQIKQRIAPPNRRKRQPNEPRNTTTYEIIKQAVLGMAPVPTPTIIEHTGYSPRTVRHYLAQLVNEGLIYATTAPKETIGLNNVRTWHLVKEPET